MTVAVGLAGPPSAIYNAVTACSLWLVHPPRYNDRTIKTDVSGKHTASTSGGQPANASYATYTYYTLLS